MLLILIITIKIIILLKEFVNKIFLQRIDKFTIIIQNSLKWRQLERLSAPHK